MSECKNMQAVILAGGDALRFQEKAMGIYDKCLMAPVDVPLINYSLDNIRLMGIKRVVIVGRNELGDLRRHLGKRADDLDITILPRSPKPGLAYALEVIEPYIGAHFVLLCGDEVYLGTNFDQMLPSFFKSGADGVCAVRQGRTRATLQNYAVEVAGGRIVSLDEKPTNISPTALMGCGLWILPPEIFRCLGETPLHPRTGRLELVDVIGTLIKRGAALIPFMVKGSYINVNRREDFVSARKIILDQMMAMGRLRPDLEPPPLEEIQLEPTVRCNLKCVMCPSKRRLHSSIDMSFDTFRMVVDQIPDLQIARLHGIGESLLNPDFISFCEYLKGKDCFVAFNDNFTLITDEVAERLVVSGVNEIRVSCDAATPDLYAMIRGRDALAGLKEGVRRIQMVKHARQSPVPRLIMVSVIMRENLKQLAELVSLASDLRLEEISFQTQLNWGVSAGALGFTIEEAEAAIAAARIKARTSGMPMKSPRLRERRIPSCIWPWTACYITADAYVTPCCNLADPTVINFGTLSEHTVQEIWHSNQYAAFRRRMVSDDPYPACATCPYYDGTFKVFFD